MRIPGHGPTAYRCGSGLLIELYNKATISAYFRSLSGCDWILTCIQQDQMAARVEMLQGTRRDASRNEATNRQSRASKQCGYVSASIMVTMFEVKGDAVQPKVDIFWWLTHHRTDWLGVFWLRSITSSLSSFSSLLFRLHTQGYAKYDRSAVGSQVCVHDLSISSKLASHIIRLLDCGLHLVTHENQLGSRLEVGQQPLAEVLMK